MIGTRNGPLRYHVVQQSVDELRDPGNGPSVSMSTYLVATGQQSLLTKLSVYSERGPSASAARLLYMNAVALALWQAMGHSPTITDMRHRPPPTALLALGVPFSE